MNAKLITLNVLTLSALAAVLLYGQGAGPLDPPSNPADGVYRTLEEVYNAAADPRIPIDSLPVTISAPGSYYFRHNFVYSLPSGHAITIEADHVTIDLNGFVLSSTPAVTGDAIHVELNRNYLVVRNGAIVGNSTSGSPAGFAKGIDGNDRCRISDISVSGCRESGISVAGGSVVVRCVLADNQHNGISTSGSVIAHCSATHNELRGFFALHSSIHQSSCEYNGSGIHGIGSVVAGCRSSENEHSGILAAVALGCVAYSNDVGIEADVVSQCAAHSNDSIGLRTRDGGEGAISLSHGSAAFGIGAIKIDTTGTRTGNFPAP